MRAWLIANRYAVSAVALTALCVVALGLLVQPQACANPNQASGAPPDEPTLQPVADLASQPSHTPRPTEPPASAEATPDVASENPASSGQAAVPGADASTHAGTALLACSTGGDLDWSTTADEFQIVCQCTLTLPADGWAYLSAGGSVANGRCECEYEGHFRLGIDSTEGDPATDRWVNVYADVGDGMDAVLAVSALRPLEAGTHTFYLLGRRTEGAGTVLLRDPSLAVIAWPAPR